jgi:hypothetical protein
MLAIISGYSTMQMRSPALPEILTSSDCEPPCWYSIAPGVTTKEEVISLLPQLSFVEMKSIYMGSVSIGAKLNRSIDASEISIHFDEEEVVKSIMVNPRNRFFLRDITSFYGEPDYAIAVQGPSFRYGFRVHLIYFEKGITVGSARRPFDSTARQAEIKENYQGNVVHFFNPLLLNEVFTDFTISNYSKELFRSGLREWQGFGEIEPVFELDYR